MYMSVYYKNCKLKISTGKPRFYVPKIFAVYKNPSIWIKIQYTYVYMYLNLILSTITLVLGNAIVSPLIFLVLERIITS